MSFTLSPETERLLRTKLRDGGYASEDDLIRDALRALGERDDFFAAVTEGASDADAGRTRPLREADAALRSKYGIRRDA